VTADNASRLPPAADKYSRRKHQRTPDHHLKHAHEEVHGKELVADEGNGDEWRTVAENRISLLVKNGFLDRVEGELPYICRKKPVLNLHDVVTHSGSLNGNASGHRRE
jgi:hypothetical protein